MPQMVPASLTSQHSELAVKYAKRVVKVAKRLSAAYRKRDWAMARALELQLAVLKAWYITMLSCGNLMNDVLFGTLTWRGTVPSLVFRTSVDLLQFLICVCAPCFPSDLVFVPA